jgi:hypothetical protein
LLLISMITGDETIRTTAMNNVIPMIDNRYLIIHADQPSSPTLNIKISAIAMDNEINKIIHDLIVRAICFLSFGFS